VTKKQRIQQEIERIERVEGITIHFACESGSRAWGFDSPDSDYDVRFIYNRPINSYLSIETKPDFIEYPVVDELDFGGWDIKKALSLLYYSNAAIFEWLQSPVVYIDRNTFRKNFYDLAAEYFNPKKAIHHYLGLSKKTLLAGFHDGEIKIKAYFYILRPLLAAMWIADTCDIPPMEFRQLLVVVEDHPHVLKEIVQLLKKKKLAPEGERIRSIPVIQEFFDTQYARCHAIANSLTTKKKDTSKLDLFFRGIITL